MDREKSAKKCKCYLKHKKDQGKLVEATNETGEPYVFRRYYCFFCGTWVGDDLVKKT